MVKSVRYVLISFLIFVLFFSCSENHKKEISDTKTSYSQIGKIKDLSYSAIKRYSVGIKIPTGRKRKEVKATLERAVKEIGGKINYDAFAVFAYTRYDNSHDTMLVARAFCAPDGKWEDAGLAGPKSITFYLGDAYFQKVRTDLPEINEVAYLISKDGNKISISRERDSWEDEDIIAHLSPGTKVRVLDKYYWGTENYKFIRYYISVNNIKGWIDDRNISLERN
jgi:hypothetical protein